MSRIWFTSDTHFSHHNIIRFNPDTRVYDQSTRDRLEQGFDSTSERKAWLQEQSQDMNRHMIQKWQELVHPDDTVYHLGDVFFCGATEAREILSQLTGQIHLIYGNHDQVIRKNRDIQEQFASVHEILDTRINGINVVMCHYPMMSWNRSSHGSYHLYGHVHGALNKHTGVRSMDVGIDSRPGGRAPLSGFLGLWSWEEVHDELSNRTVENHHE